MDKKKKEGRKVAVNTLKNQKEYEKNIPEASCDDTSERNRLVTTHLKSFREPETPCKKSRCLMFAFVG